MRNPADQNEFLHLTTLIHTHAQPNEEASSESVNQLKIVASLPQITPTPQQH